MVIHDSQNQYYIQITTYNCGRHRVDLAVKEDGREG